jgi:hypothetical protein
LRIWVRKTMRNGNMRSEGMCGGGGALQCRIGRTRPRMLFMSVSPRIADIANNDQKLRVSRQKKKWGKARHGAINAQTVGSRTKRTLQCRIGRTAFWGGAVKKRRLGKMKTRPKIHGEEKRKSVCTQKKNPHSQSQEPQTWRT